MAPIRGHLTPGGMLRQALAVPLLSLAAVPSCMSIEYGSRNDSVDYLRDVPTRAAVAVSEATVSDVPGEGARVAPAPPAGEPRAAAPGTPAPGTGKPEDQALPAPEKGGLVVKEAYTVEMDGSFTVNRTTQKKVGYLGIDVDILDGADARRLKAQPYCGLVVRSLLGGGPASRSGILVDDVITSFAGKSVNGLEYLAYLVEQAVPDASVDLELLRKGEKVSLKLEVGSETCFVKSRVLERKLSVLDDRDRTGLRLAELPEELKPVVLGPEVRDGGVIVLDNVAGGPGFHADLRIRDWIVKVGGQDIRGLQDFTVALQSASPGDSIALAVLREGERLEKALEIGENELEIWGYDLLHLVTYNRSPGARRLYLLFDMLWYSEIFYSVRKKEGYPQNSTDFEWGTILSLISYRSTPKRGELRLLWFLPIGVRSE